MKRRKTNKLLIGIIVLLVEVLVAAMPASVFGADSQSPDEEPVIEEYSYVSSAYASLSLSSGTATASAGITGKPGVMTQLTATVQLQKKENGTWATIYLWNASSTSGTLSTSSAISVSKGTYRVYASFVASSGGSSEFINRTSSTKTY